jgi:hypothetical protein
MERKPLLAIAALAGAALLALGGIGQAESAKADGFCIDCLSVRLGPPMVVRGPFPDELDNHFTVLRLADGTYRGFTANGATYAVDGADVLALGGERRRVLAPGPAGSAGECGRWLNGVERLGGRVFGFVHDERLCDYDKGQTDKSMELVSSADEGLSWRDEGAIISGADAPKPGAITGEGDCGVVDGKDGYLYAYCLRNSDWQTIVVRAPDTDLGPGAWRKYRDGAWSEPGLGGAASAIGFLGTSPAYLKDFGRVATIVNDPWFGGLRLSLSADKVHFESLKEPLLPVDGAEWNRPAPTDLIAYLSLIDPADGGNAVGSDFLLAAVTIPPGEDFAHRYLVFRRVHLAMGEAPAAVQAGVALVRWKGAEGGYRISTGPMTGEEAAFQSDRTLGFLLTRAAEGRASVKLEECRSGDGREQLLAFDGSCARNGLARLRTAGWAFAGEEKGTMPLYRCREAGTGDAFASNRADCEGLGAMELRLGYVLRE